MSSTSILQPAARRAAARWHRSAGQPGPAVGRAVHLGPGGLAQRRALLEARWRDRLERVTALSLAYHEAAQCLPSAGSGSGELPSRGPGNSGPGHGGLGNGGQHNSGPGNGGAMSRRARQLARRAVAERQALAEIEAALERMTAGQYGWCEQCGRQIAAALLTAHPQARYCAACGRQPAHSMA